MDQQLQSEHATSRSNSRRYSTNVHTVQNGTHDPMRHLAVADRSKIRIAFDSAILSTHGKYRLGASLFRGNRLVSVGVNKIKTHTKSPHFYRMIHAEIDALLRGERESIEGSSLFVVRVLKNLNFASSKPCKCCWTMAAELGVKRVVYYDKISFVSDYL
jgi:deoxycytidylate deaminase